jgi:hypothetical protein
VDDLPPGAYLLAVVVVATAATERSRVLHADRQPIAITLAEGQSLVQDLQIGG